MSRQESLHLDGTLKLDVPEHTHRNVVIALVGCRSRLEIQAEPGSQASILLVRRNPEAMELDAEVHVRRDASLKLGLLDLEGKDLQFRLDTRLEEEGAFFEVRTGQLVTKTGARTGSLKVVHKAPYTAGQIHNFAVVKAEATYEMAATGAIEKGCHDSSSHQETRVLTLGNGHKTKVLPILLIDENEVQASHAMSVGQPDENQLYYLQSRGLSPESALGLLAIGYFLPVIELTEDEGLRESLREEMERKAGLYGH